MYASTARRLCSLVHRHSTRPSLLFYPAAASSNSNTQHIPSLFLTPTSLHLTRPSVRSFARRSYEPPDDTEAVAEDEEISKKAEEELEEEEERRQARGPSKAERLRLKEKEKRRQKLAMRERVDNKKEKKVRGERGGGRRGGRLAEDDFDDDDAIDLYDELDADMDATAELDLTASTTGQLGGGRSDALIAERQRQKKEMLRQRFERQEAEEEGEDEEDEEEEDKEAERPVNEAITAPAIVLIDGAGKRIGLVSTPVALKKARESNLDIVTLSPPHISPPIARVVNYADWLAMERQRKGQQTDSHKRAKTLQLRKAIDQHDLQVKCAAMRRLLQKGHSVRVQYFEKSVSEGEWVELFGRVAALVDGSGVCHDMVSKPIAVFEPVRKKKEGGGADEGGRGQGGRKEKVKQEQQKQQQLVAADGDKTEGGVGGDSVRTDVKQHAKAAGE